MVDFGLTGLMLQSQIGADRITNLDGQCFELSFDFQATAVQSDLLESSFGRHDRFNRVVSICDG